MAAELRVLHLADSHIGVGLPVRPRVDRPRRGDDIVASYRRVMARALEDGVDLVIHAGDVFNRSNPSSGAVTAAAEPLLAAAAAAGIPVVIVPGNHERSRLPPSLLLSHANIHIAREPGTWTFCIRGVRVVVAAVPFIREKAAERFPPALAETGWETARADVLILAAHQTFESATSGPGSYRFRSGDDVVERDAIPAAFDYVAAGHIHRHQVLQTPHGDGPPIVYTGSPDRISFAEKDEPKGCVITEAAGGRLSHTFVEHAVRPMVILPMDVTGLTGDQTRRGVAALLDDLPAGAVAQVRLSGQARPGAMRGLALAHLARELRPDVLVTVSMRTVEFKPDRGGAAPAARRNKSAFSCLDAPSGEILAFSPDAVKSVPTCCGTYALFDAAGRLLYVGKAKHVRPRVRNHVGGSSATGYFSGWTRQISRIEVRVAHGELEALLVEAELIRRLRPPFNRQMRHWPRYCYLCENGRPHGQLEIRQQPPDGARCFGPFANRTAAESLLDAVSGLFGVALCPPEDRRRSGVPLLPKPSGAMLCNRYFDGRCAGPCAERVEATDYADRLHRRGTFLAGTDDAALAATASESSPASEQPRSIPGDLCDREAARTEARGSSSARRRVGSSGRVGDDGRDDDASRAREDQARWLRIAFDRLAVLHEARHLVGGLLLLAGPEDRRVVAVLDQAGLHLDVLRNDEDDALRVLRRYKLLLGNREPAPAQRPDKSTVDCLITAARRLRQPDHDDRFVPPPRAIRLDARDLLHCAFAGTG